MLIAQFSPSSELLKAFSWGGGAVDYGIGTIIDDQGAVWITGYTRSYGAGSDDALLIKLSLSGGLQRAFVWGGPKNDSGYSLAVNAQGSLWALFNTCVSGEGLCDFCLLNFALTGEQQSAFCWGGTNHEIPISLAIDAQGYIWTVGMTESFGTGANDVFIAKVDSSGRIEGRSSELTQTDVMSMTPVALSVQLQSITTGTLTTITGGVRCHPFFHRNQ